MISCNYLWIMNLRIIAHCDFDMWLYNVPSGLRNDLPPRRHWHEKLNYGSVCMLPSFSNFIASSLFLRVPLPHFLRLPSVCFICSSRTTLLIMSLAAITWSVTIRFLHVFSLVSLPMLFFIWHPLSCVLYSPED